MLRSTLALLSLLAGSSSAAFNVHHSYPSDLVVIDYSQPDTALGSSQKVDLFFDRGWSLFRANILRFTNIPADATDCKLWYYWPPAVLFKASKDAFTRLGVFTTQVNASTVDETATTWQNRPGPWGASPNMGVGLQVYEGSNGEALLTSGSGLDSRAQFLHPGAHSLIHDFTCPPCGTAAFMMSLDLLYMEEGPTVPSVGWGTLNWYQGFGPDALRATLFRTQGFYIEYQTPCSGADCLFSQ